MNNENIKTLIEALRKSETFNMSRFYADQAEGRVPGHVCNTPACIAGHADMLFSDPAVRGHMNDVNGDGPSERAAKALGLTPKQASDLFLNNYTQTEIRAMDITVKDAIGKLQRALNTGEITPW